MIDIKKLRLSYDELKKLTTEYDVMEAQLAKALWGLVSYLGSGQTQFLPSGDSAADIQAMLEAAGIRRPE